MFLKNMNNEGSDKKGGAIVMHEVQRPPWYANTIALVIAAVTWCGFIQQIMLGIPFGTKPASDIEMWILFLLFGICFPLFFLSLKLVTKTEKEGIVIRFFPFRSRFIPYQQIKNVQVRPYHPMSYGGWGIRWSLKKGRAYTMKGKRGIWIELTDGDGLYLGSQKPEKLAKYIQRECLHR
jgi:hypothetical protein